MEKGKFKDLDEIENGKKNDTKHEKDEEENIDDEASGDRQSADEVSEKKNDQKKKDDHEKQDDRINTRFIPLMRIPLYLNKPFYPWMKQSYCFHPVCHGKCALAPFHIL